MSKSLKLTASGARVAVVILGLTAIASGASAQTASPRPAPAMTPTKAQVTEPPPAGYVIGPEDVLGVLFWREQDLSGDVTVRPDGIITLPVIGDIRAAGKSTDTLRDEIRKVAEKYVAEPTVTVVVRQLNSRKVFITGEVATPGPFPLIGPRTVMQLIALAGGVTEFADSENISIMREEGGKTRSFKFNYREVARGKKLEQNILLLPGDTVVVP